MVCVRGGEGGGWIGRARQRERAVDMGIAIEDETKSSAAAMAADYGVGGGRQGGQVDGDMTGRVWGDVAEL